MNISDWFKNNLKDIAFFVGLVGAVWWIYSIGTTSQVSAIVTTWRWILIIMILFIILASWLVTGNLLFGWLINEQNRMSLSRLQMFLWTVVVLSAFATAVFANLHFGNIDTAVAIRIPEALWQAMGISTASLVGTGLILESKKDKDPKDVKLSDVEKRTGVLVVQGKPSLLDLIRGEEVGNSEKIDLTRLQNLFFTFVLVGTYMSSLSAMFANLAAQTPEIMDVAETPLITSFPELGSSALALLLISHGGYLAAKAIDKQPTEPTKPPEPPK